MKNIETLSLQGVMVVGTDLRNGENFSEFHVAIEAPGIEEEIIKTFSELGYRVTRIYDIGAAGAQVDLHELYIKAGGPAPVDESTEQTGAMPSAEPPAEAPEDTDQQEQTDKPQTKRGRKPNPPVAEGAGELDEQVIRRVHAALVDYVAKHGADNLRLIVRATGNRVTEKTLNTMIEDPNAEGLKVKYFQAVDKALQKMTLTEAGGAES